MKKEEAENMILSEDPHKPIYWLSCADKLLLLGFSLEEIQTAIKKSGLKVENLTSKEDYENGTHQQKAELIQDWHTSNYIRVYKNVKIDNQYIAMEGYKTGRVQTFRVVDKYQGLKHGKIIKILLEKRFKWFNKFKWDIYEFNYQDPKDYEIYLKTSQGTLYVPILALLNNDFSIISERMIKYYKDYRLTSSYELNKKSGETIEEFKERKLKEYENDIKPLKSIQAKKLKDILDKTKCKK